MTHHGKRGLYLKKNALKIRSENDWCGGCSIFKPDKIRCQDPVLDKIWKRCKCKICLIKGLCNEECEAIQKYRNNYLNKRKTIREEEKVHGGVGEVANATGCGPVIHGFDSHTSPQFKKGPSNELLGKN